MLFIKISCFISIVWACISKLIETIDSSIHIIICFREKLNSLLLCSTCHISELCYLWLLICIQCSLHHKKTHTYHYYYYSSSCSIFWLPFRFLSYFFFTSLSLCVHLKRIFLLKILLFSFLDYFCSLKKRSKWNYLFF